MYLERQSVAAPAAELSIAIRSSDKPSEEVRKNRVGASRHETKPGKNAGELSDVAALKLNSIKSRVSGRLRRQFVFMRRADPALAIHPISAGGRLFSGGADRTPGIERPDNGATSSFIGLLGPRPAKIELRPRQRGSSESPSEGDRTSPRGLLGRRAGTYARRRRMAAGPLAREDPAGPYCPSPLANHSIYIRFEN